MSLPVQPPVLSPPPPEYDRSLFANWLAQFDLFFKRLNNQGPLRGSTLNLSDLPTSAAGLMPGDVWYDPTDSNRLKIVP